MSAKMIKMTKQEYHEHQEKMREEYLTAGVDAGLTEILLSMKHDNVEITPDPLTWDDLEKIALRNLERDHGKEKAEEMLFEGISNEDWNDLIEKTAIECLEEGDLFSDEVLDFFGWIQE